MKALIILLLLLPYSEQHVVLSGDPLTSAWRDVSAILPCGDGVVPGAKVACWIPEHSVSVGSPQLTEDRA